MSSFDEESARAHQRAVTEKSRIPILIIPGFMSSGLEVTESTLRPDWVGKRIWINLSSLGFNSIHFAGQSVQQSDQRQGHHGRGLLSFGGNTNKKNNSTTLVDDDLDENSHQHMKYKSDWLSHMALSTDDMTTEREGVKVRPIKGLSGVDYLSPGTLTDHVSYVFGPVIKALMKKGGYRDGVDLQASPYDWRLPPTAMEGRDQYFTRTMDMIEDMCSDGQNGVVLMCHSLGCKVGHYLLTFAKQQRGQEWIDRYIHTYMPVGGPHLGAPRALRGVLSGTKMSLDAFLNDDEALSFGRTLGSGPWLFPAELPHGAPSCMMVRPQGMLEVRVKTPIDVRCMLEGRAGISQSKQFKLSCVFGKTVVTSESFHDKHDNYVAFGDERFLFATSSKGPYLDNPDGDNHTGMEGDFQILLLEPGAEIGKYRKRTLWDRMCCCFCCICCCAVYVPFRLFCAIARGIVVLSAEAVTRAVGSCAVLALSKPIKVSDVLKRPTPKNWFQQSTAALFGGGNKQNQSTPSGGGGGAPGTIHKTVSVELFYGQDKEMEEGMCHKKPTPYRVDVEISWHPQAHQLGPELAETSSHSTNAKTIIDKVNVATHNPPMNRGSIGCPDLLRREGLQKTVLSMMESTYDQDPVGPRGLSSIEPPPTKRVKAIYGVNLPTEVSGVYAAKAGTTYSSVHNLFELDQKAALLNKRCGYRLKGGILEETKETKQTVLDTGNTVRTSGDGTVPYWSLQHVRSWKGPCDVTVDEIDRAEHRDILADDRFHRIVLDYCVAQN